MDRRTQLELIDELLRLKASGTPFLDASVSSSRVEDYIGEARFAHERDAILRRLPHAAAHRSELGGAGAFLRCDVHGLPLLLTRDSEGAAHAFLNVCRHRGARLVEEAAGCSQRFTCPYHGWTYANSGRLIGAPHFDSSFDGLDRTQIALKPVPVQEAFGFLWVVADPGGAFDFDAWFAPLASDLDGLDMAGMVIAAEDRIDSAANWKLLVEGGIESYHFRVAHRETIAPYFEDNLSSYRSLGPHLRSILPRTSLVGLAEQPPEDRHLRDHANMVYTLFPATQLLVQQDHVVWLRQEPLAPGRTVLRIATLAPTGGPLAEGGNDDHWQRNHAITVRTLEEDIRLGEGIQAGLASGANERLLFGRFEGALDRFNRTVAGHLATGAEKPT